MTAVISDISRNLDDAPLSKFHFKSVFVAGMGFFTDSYDLFVIATVTQLLSSEWKASATSVALVNSMTLLGAFIGAIVYGRIADIVGRQKIYGLETMIMFIFALLSAFSPNITFLIVCRFILGLGIGGDYPVSAVLMSEYSNKKNRGMLVGMVFGLQALGTIFGYLLGILLIEFGVAQNYTWRILLGVGAIFPAIVMFYRRKMPESPRFAANVLGDSSKISDIAKFTKNKISTTGNNLNTAKFTLKEFLTNRKYVISLIGTAGTWFLFDYAFYGNAVSAPEIATAFLGKTASIQDKLILNLIIFTVAAVPGFILAILFMDKIGHRKLQLIGFPLMGLAILGMAMLPDLQKVIVPFAVLFGLSYFFAEFGPNTTTFVLSAECYPTSARTTGHGISAGIAKLGAFLGVFLFPIIQHDLGVKGALIFAAIVSFLGFGLTFLIPETSGRSLEEISEEWSYVKPSSAIPVAS